ncbi:MAG: RluA family pseudouridine synthase [Clostridia bacterium]|nr:RluA family pseudouridine synthase [Clostridia bacterium]
MEILFQDKYIIVCRKESGMLSEGEGESCLPTLIAAHLRESGETDVQVYPVHRLDRETVGATVFALTKEAAASLSEQIQRGTFEKEYLALCHGRPEKESDILRDLLFYDRRRGKSFAVDRKRAGVKEASLEYTTVSSNGELSLLRVKLHTGRTHQIRVQFASRKHPLAGDRRYGAPKSEFSSVALVAHRLSFDHPKSGERLTFTVEPPENMINY